MLLTYAQIDNCTDLDQLKRLEQKMREHCRYASGAKRTQSQNKLEYVKGRIRELNGEVR